MDLWINIDNYLWPASLKIVDGLSLQALRIASWIIMIYSLLVSLVYISQAVNVDILDFNSATFSIEVFVEVVASLFALIPAFSFLNQVNAYLSYY